MLLRRRGLALIDWAAACRTVEKVSLWLIATSHRAIGSCRKFGSCEEGRLAREIKFGPGHCEDELLMCRFVNRAAAPAS